MNSSSPPSTPADVNEIIFEIPDAIRIYRSGRVERLTPPDELVPPSLDQPTGVQSKDVPINPATGLSARLYLPPSPPTTPKKLPVLLSIHGGGFFPTTPKKPPVLLSIHGGGFCLIRASSSRYHAHLNSLTARAGILSVSVDYRLAPENPLPAAYDDCWEALEWVLAVSDPWLSEFGDLDNIFVAGDSAGANIVHNVGMRLGREGKEVEGLVMVHPFFWGKDRIGNEGMGERGKGESLKVKDADALWPVVCPETTGLDDPRINPVAVDAPSLAALGCRRVLVCVTELDLLRDRGRLYYRRLKESGWEGEAEFFESEGEDHCFYFKKPESSEAEEIMERLANFFNKSKPSTYLNFA
ncbi:LOW QUALITY PROTEIN: probable carboxylesterase 2 [Phalaenopsis equestris]|uniref:LOW QUALITY PROTEIN: probable carboxylesterase 2 n=1 Tax=Phalaenopsis equestris TaxID=78828 RepID=UPI0009E2AA49|nr:LOW QUALITY PROTEIN: probable carboxylesterase 2 [Phalaenopsis equestris]